MKIIEMKFGFQQNTVWLHDERAVNQGWASYTVTQLCNYNYTRANKRNKLKLCFEHLCGLREGLNERELLCKRARLKIVCGLNRWESCARNNEFAGAKNELWLNFGCPKKFDPRNLLSSGMFIWERWGIDPKRCWTSHFSAPDNRHETSVLACSAGSLWWSGTHAGTSETSGLWKWHKGTGNWEKCRLAVRVWKGHTQNSQNWKWDEVNKRRSPQCGLGTLTSDRKLKIVALNFCLHR